jgi:hypothetical protein
VKTNGFDLFAIVEGDPIAIEESLGKLNLEMIKKKPCRQDR